MGLKKKTIEAMSGLVSETIAIRDLSLEVLEGPHQGKVLQLEKEVIRMGREDWCDLSLPNDPWVSTLHCECYLVEKGLRVLDLRSRNGIRLNDSPILDAYMLPGARLQLGQSVLTLRSSPQTKELSIQYHDSTGTLIGKSMAMRKIFSILPRLGQRKVTTLLYGETGTGKTSIAQAIHRHNQNEDAPFVVVNCGALPPALAESMLFGHERGAFTGADKQRQGFFEQADGGTLFLDEIAELPLELQPKLLDVLERRKVRRLGSNSEQYVDFHLLTATHKDLQEECEVGRFREDLYFRLSVMVLTMPPLRERKEDLPLLIEAFLKELCPERPLFLTGEATNSLKVYLWPGNIRELRNVLERTLVFLDNDTIEASDLVFEKRHVVEEAGSSSLETFMEEEDLLWMKEVFPTLPLSEHQPPPSLKDILKHTERFFIEQALVETEHNAPKTARLLTISESWLYSRIKLYGLKSKRKG